LQGGPSKTAWRVALRRAAHQIIDNPLVLDDPIALRIVGEAAAAAIRQSPWKHQLPFSRASRAFLVARSRFAEDALADAVRRGVRQYVVLGAGLDTFAYRNPFSEDGLRVFEVDYPATQDWKRRALHDAAVDVPSTLTFVAVDFERASLEASLVAAGFDRTAPAFFSWLGVTWYLTAEAISQVLAFVASTPSHGGIAFDYGVPRESVGVVGRLAYDAVAARVAMAGEPFRSAFDPAALRAELERIGFRAIADLGANELNARYFAGRSDRFAVVGATGRVVSAEIPWEDAR
jgi:methyltransferase (TIGR00027 family)